VGIGAVILVTPADRGAIASCPEVEGECGVVLVRRRFEPMAGHWSLPGGMLEVGETLHAGVAREVLEETGLAVSVGPVVEVVDRITLDDDGRVRHHYVVIDYLCRPAGGVLGAASDASEIAVADPGRLAPFGVTEQIVAVVDRALELAGFRQKPGGFAPPDPPTSSLAGTP
jgi:ADP-ribose pyrophosphatase YjhB (NUDIX family)